MQGFNFVSPKILIKNPIIAGITYYTIQFIQFFRLGLSLKFTRFDTTKSKTVFGALAALHLGLYATSASEDSCLGTLRRLRLSNLTSRIFPSDINTQISSFITFLYQTQGLFGAYTLMSTMIIRCGGIHQCLIHCYLVRQRFVP